MRRGFLIAVAAVTFSVGAATLLVIVANRPRISLENFERIQEGMTQGQVEAILGGPPRWEVEAKRSDEALVYFLRSDVLSPAEWWGRKGVVTVYYDNKAHVSKKLFKELPFEPEPPTLWEFLSFRTG